MLVLKATDKFRAQTFVFGGQACCQASLQKPLNLQFVILLKHSEKSHTKRLHFEKPRDVNFTPEMWLLLKSLFPPLVPATGSTPTSGEQNPGWQTNAHVEQCVCSFAASQDRHIVSLSFCLSPPFLFLLFFIFFSPPFPLIRLHMSCSSLLWMWPGCDIALHQHTTSGLGDTKLLPWLWMPARLLTSTSGSLPRRVSSAVPQEFLSYTTFISFSKEYGLPLEGKT